MVTPEVYSNYNPTNSSYKNDPHLSIEVKQFLETINTGGPGLETLSSEEARKVLEKLQAYSRVDISGIEVSERIINSDGLKIVLNVIRPAKVKEKLPVFLFIHGGGWVLGDFPTHQRLVRDLVVLSGSVCVFVNYSRTPETIYPKAINQCYATLKWIYEYGELINVDGKRLALVGNSVGGCMAIATSILAKERRGPKIKLQVLLWPVTDSNFETDSYKEYGEERFLTANMMKWMFELYLPEKEKRKEIYASPLSASIEQLRGLPPTLLQVAENDVLRDEGEAFGRKLNEAGVKVTTTRYNGMIHDFGLLNGLSHLTETKSALLQAAAELKKHLD